MTPREIAEKCSVCHKYFPLSNFTNDKRPGRFRLSYCKTCERLKKEIYAKSPKGIAKRREYARGHPEKMAEYNRKYRARHPKEMRERQRNWALRNKEKTRAHKIVNRAIANGKMISMPCINCGKKAYAHHDDYSKPMIVIWLCQLHHKARHRELAAIRAQGVGK